jgi:hypothetical protein
MMRCCSRVTLFSTSMVNKNTQGKPERVRTKIFFVSSIEVSLKYAVGPSGKCTRVIASSRSVIWYNTSGGGDGDTH